MQLKWSMKCSPLVLVVTGDEVSYKHSTSSQLCLWMSPSRELPRRMCCPWGTVGLMEEQEEAFLTAPALHLWAAPCEGAEGWESCSAPCSPAPSHWPHRRYHLGAAPGAMGMMAQVKLPQGSLG